MYAVATVLKPQGIKGEVKVEVLTSFPEHLEEIETLYLKGEDYKALTVEATRFSNRFAFIKFSEINDRNQAELLRGHDLCIPEDELYELEEDEFYQHELEGLQVFDEQGVLLGVVKRVENYPANDILVVEDRFGKEQMVPAVKEFVRQVDVENRKIVIRVMDGLFD